MTTVDHYKKNLGVPAEAASCHTAVVDGVVIEGHVPAQDIKRLLTDKGDIRCEIVVNAAGYYAQRVGEWFRPYGGRTVPMATMSPATPARVSVKPMVSPSTSTNP